MLLNLSIQKINNFFLILYGEFSALIGPIPRLFVTDALSMHVGGTCRKWMDGQRARRTQSDDTQLDL